MFKYDWSKTDVKTGLVFMVGVLVTFNVLGGTVAAQAVGTSALLAWCTLLLVPPQSRRRDFTGLAIYLVLGVPLVWLSHVATPSTPGFLIAMFGVTFLAYMMLLIGGHEFMIGWCLAYWFMLVPLFVAGASFETVMLSHVVGTSIVIVVNVLKPLWTRKPKLAPVEAPPSEPAAAPEYSLSYMLSYATVVATSIAGGVGIGARWGAVDPTVIANGTINIISPSLRQVWRAAVERILLVSAGVIVGFYLGWFFPNEQFGLLVIAATAFAAMATVAVSFGVLMFFLMIMTAYPWGVMHDEMAHVIANQKLLGDAFGAVIAVLVIAVLVRLKNSKRAPKAHESEGPHSRDEGRVRT